MATQEELLQAIREKRPDKVADALQAGASLLEPTQDGVEPLMEALRIADIPTIRAIVSLGHILALESGVVRLRRRPNSILSGVLDEAKKRWMDEQWERQSQLYDQEKHAQVKRMTKGRTQVHLSCLRNDHRRLVKLLEEGHDANVVDDDGNTALHLATRHQNLECMQVLIERGARYNLKNNDKHTPLDIAKRVGIDNRFRSFVNERQYRNKAEEQRKRFAREFGVAPRERTFD